MIFTNKKIPLYIIEQSEEFTSEVLKCQNLFWIPRTFDLYVTFLLNNWLFYKLVNWGVLFLANPVWKFIQVYIVVSYCHLCCSLLKEIFCVNKGCCIWSYRNNRVLFAMLHAFLYILHIYMKRYEEFCKAVLYSAEFQYVEHSLIRLKQSEKYN